MDIKLRDATNDDLPLIERWLHADHVRRAWGDPDTNVQLLRHAPAKGNWRAIIEADDRAVGLILWQHPTRLELDVAGLIDIPVNAIDIDILIGEQTAVGRGIGPAALNLVAGTVLSNPAVPFVMACARLDNLASRRAFAKAGFREDREFDDVPNGTLVLMMRQRQESTQPIAPVKLRLATPADYAGMHRVRLAVRENTLSSPDVISHADYLDAIQHAGRSWVVEADGEIVAFASGLLSGNVWALFVHPEHEGLGHGSNLHVTMVDWLWSQGLSRLWLTTGPGTRAEGFYISRGWRACGIVDGGDLRLELDRS